MGSTDAAVMLSSNDDDQLFEFTCKVPGTIIARQSQIGNQYCICSPVCQVILGCPQPVKSLPIGHKSMLRTLKIFANFCEADDYPIVNWTAVTKKDFDDFRYTGACMHATERDDAIAPFTMLVTFSKSSFAAGGMQGDFGLTDGEAALHHVLFEVICQPWSEKLVETLERSGFNEIQDVLLTNQAERDMLTFLDANDVITPLPHDKKVMLFNLKLFKCFCEETGKPIMDFGCKFSRLNLYSSGLALHVTEQLRR